MIARALARVPLALAGGALGGGLVALVEARATSAEAPRAALTAHFAGTLGVAYPIALAAAALATGFWIAVEPGVPRTPWEHVRALRDLPVLARGGQILVPQVKVPGTRQGLQVAVAYSDWIAYRRNARMFAAFTPCQGAVSTLE